ncbi:MAG: histidine kinase [Deltaproteobacteria bacterium]|nr:histidine kinase [Deltaproteobacteria bacterium]
MRSSEHIENSQRKVDSLSKIPEKNGGDAVTSAKISFKKLGNRFKTGLLLAFLLPIAALSAYFHFQFTFSLKESAQLNLAAISESQRNTVDLFLQERIVNIFSLFQSKGFSLTPTRLTMENYLQNLRQVSDAFIDVGFLNSSGIQIGYAGPFPFLQNKNYAGEAWFSKLMQQNRNHYISDIYLGFRNKPHFTIAVKQLIDGTPYVVRSTLDPDKFYMFLRTINHAKGVESALINQAFTYQIVDPVRGKLFGLSDFRPSSMTGTGVQEIKKNGDAILVAYSWLKETPWALIVKEPLNLAHAQMYRARRIMIAGLVCITVMVVLVIWFTTNNLVNRARDSAEKQDELQVQLLHAAKLASIGELATGVAHEINNPLAVIMATTGVVKDMLNPEFGLDADPESILKELGTVDSAVVRAKAITQKLLDYGRKHAPLLVPCNINHLVDEVLNGFKQRELEIQNIEIRRHYGRDLPKILVDPDQVRQVLLNIINNAGDAIKDSGAITISTASDSDHALVNITDSGHGMTSDQVKKIFDPFYTTKDVGKGTGLGLSVSMSIVKSMGGFIDVQSIPGVGSSFTVSFPIYKGERSKNGAEPDSRQASCEANPSSYR